MSDPDEQEPVAWRITYMDGTQILLIHEPPGLEPGYYKELVPLYTALPKPEQGAAREALMELPKLWRIEAQHREDKGLGPSYTNALEHCALDLEKALATQPAEEPTP